MRQPKELLKKRLEEIIGEYTAKTGFKPEKIVIRRQRTKCGSCSSS